MKNVVVPLALLATTSAIGAPAQTKAWRITVKGTSFDTGCLPALSARGTVVAVPVVDPDGERGLPNLLVVFFPVDGRPPASTVVLTAAEVDEVGGGKLGASVLQMIEPRLDLVNAQLSVAGFAPLRAVEADALKLELKDGTLAIRGPRMEDETVAVAGSAAGGEGANAPFLGGGWGRGAGARDIVVRIDYRGGETGAVPRPAWRLVHVRGAASPPSASPGPGAAVAGPSQASLLNTRAMRKFRARDWTGAAADFRAAIDAYSGHV